MLVRLRGYFALYEMTYFSAKNYEYYGVHSRNKCYCDNDYGEVLLDDRFAMLNAIRGDSFTILFSTCNLPCPGNGSLMCGGFQGTSTYGPIPRRPSVAQFSAHRTCKPWCPVGFSINSHQVMLSMHAATV